MIKRVSSVLDKYCHLKKCSPVRHLFRSKLINLHQPHAKHFSYFLLSSVCAIPSRTVLRRSLLFLKLINNNNNNTKLTSQCNDCSTINKIKHYYKCSGKIQNVLLRRSTDRRMVQWKTKYRLMH